MTHAILQIRSAAVHNVTCIRADVPVISLAHNMRFWTKPHSISLSLLSKVLGGERERERREIAFWNLHDGSTFLYRLGYLFCRTKDDQRVLNP